MACSYSPGVRNAWQKRGFKVVDANIDSFKDKFDAIYEELKRRLYEAPLEFVFSFDFSSDLSKACNELKLIYISWVWDCPHTNLWSLEARYECNRIFLFDYEQFLVHVRRGLKHVYYLPLASDYDYFLKVISQSSESQKEKYKSEVSFVGNLYTDNDHNLFDQISFIPPYSRGYLDSLFCIQKGVWGVNFLKNGISDRVWRDIRQYVKWDLGERYECGVYEENIMYMLQTKIAQIERIEMCNALAEKYNFNLYTNCNTEFNPHISNNGYAGYLTDMPLIFKESKINIHITMRAIETGIPLRVMDVLACGGFLLTNYQKEIDEFFVDGKELVIYYDLEDMLEKIEYYLEHEEERNHIAQKGQQKVIECFSYDKQINTIVATLEKEDILSFE